MLLIVVLALVIGYSVGRFSTLEERVTTTTTTSTTSRTVDQTYSLVVVRVTTTTSYPHGTTTVTKYGTTITVRATYVYTVIEGLTITTTETIRETTYGSTTTITKSLETTTKTTTVFSTTVLKQHIQIEELFEQNWILQSLMIDGQQVALSAETNTTKQFAIQFDEEGMVSGYGGCNGFTGDYQTTDEYKIVDKSDQGEDQIGVGGSMSFGPLLRTAMGCVPPSLMEQENQFFAALELITLFQVLDKNLKLTTTDEQTVLNFTSE